MSMSITYNIFKEIVKRGISEQLKKEKKLRTGEKIGVVVSLIVFMMAFVCFIIRLAFLGTLFSFIGYLILAIVMLLDSKPKSNEELKEMLPQVKSICLGLKDMELYSIEVISELQNEIHRTLEEKNQNTRLLYKRISVIFVSIFLIPLGFLTKYYLDGSTEILNEETYFSLIFNLLNIAIILIGLLYAIGQIIDSVIQHDSIFLKIVNNYVNDVKYMLLMDEEKIE